MLFSTSIENKIYEKEGTYVILRDPSRGCKLLLHIVEKYQNNFKSKLGPQDRMNVPPVKLIIDEEIGIKPSNHVKPFDTLYDFRVPWEKELKDALCKSFSMVEQSFPRAKK